MTAYNFAGIALNTPPNPGDTVQWDGTRWIPVAMSGAGTWAQVLVEGNVSGPRDPTISSGQALRFLGVTEETDGLIAGEDSSGGDSAQDIVVQGGEHTTDGDAGSVRIRGGVANGAGDGGTAVMFGGDSFAGLGGAARLIAGDGNSGGEVFISGGNASAAESPSGNVIVRPGVGPTTAGQIQLQHAGANVGIRISAQADPHLGNQAILVADGGLSFFNGTPAERPSVTGSRGGNAALASLLTVLGDMGLITDNTTA